MAQVLLKVDLSPTAMLVLNDIAGAGSGITQAAADLRYLKLAADNDPLTGTLTTEGLIPSSATTYDIGSTAVRYKDIFAQRFNGLVGTLTSLTTTGTYLSSLRGGTGSGTKNVSVTSSGATSLHAVFAAVEATVGGSASLTVSGRGNTVFATIEEVTADTTTLDAGGVSNFYSTYVSGGGTVIGNSFDEANFLQGRCSGGVLGLSQVYGSFVQGYAVSTGAGPGSITVSGASFVGGAFVQGAAVDGTLVGTSDGVFVQGYALNNSTISATFGGAMARGLADNGFNITAAGLGAGAFGYADDQDIVASASNAFQFGKGTNAQANSLKVGTAGLRFWGSGTPGVPVNGDIYVSGGYVVVQSNGVAVNIEPAGGGLTHPQILARTLGA